MQTSTGCHGRSTRTNQINIIIPSIMDCKTEALAARAGVGPPPPRKSENPLTPTPIKRILSFFLYSTPPPRTWLINLLK